MLTKRNLMLFFRDKANVFFSLLAVFIIIGLYVLFLGDSMEAALHAQLGFESDQIGVAMASIMLGGMVAVTSVTSCLGAISISIKDKEEKDGAGKDFITSPISRGKIVASYVLSTAAVGAMMTVAALILCMAYIVVIGGSLPSAQGAAQLVITTVLSVLCANAVIFFISIFVKSQSAFSALSTVVGTLIGFVMGIYIPIGQLPDAVGWVIKCFPMSHAASMYRQVLADGVLAELFMDAPPEALDSMRQTFGIVFDYDGYSSDFWMSGAVLLVTAAVFYALSILAMKNRRA